MILTDDDDTAERNRSLRNLCFQAGKRFYHEETGWNYRMTNLQAALGLAPLETLDRTLQQAPDRPSLPRTAPRTATGYSSPCPPPPSRTTCTGSSAWSRDATEESTLALTRGLGDRKIGTRPFFWPMHEQPAFHRMGLFEGLRLPVAERLARTGFYLPSGTGTSDEQVHHVAQTLKQLL